MNKESALILGARSDIGLAVAHRLAKCGLSIQLAAREIDSLEYDRADLNLRNHVNVTLHEFDVLQTQTHEEFVSSLPFLPHIVVCAVGILGNQDIDENSTENTQLVIRTNFEGPASILGIMANHFESRGSGVIIGISSVAGLRGRASNYIYGSSKAGFTTFLSGLRNHLSTSEIDVITILPGYVTTRMTENKNLPTRVTTSPEVVAKAISNAISKRRNVVYVLPIWRVIMFIIRCIPERVFKHMSL